MTYLGFFCFFFFAVQKIRFFLFVSNGMSLMEGPVKNASEPLHILQVLLCELASSMTELEITHHSYPSSAVVALLLMMLLLVL